jgi:hypothetical protein
MKTHQGFPGRHANQNSHEIVPSTKMIKFRAIKGNQKSQWRDSHSFASHPEVEKNSLTYEE